MPQRVSDCATYHTTKGDRFEANKERVKNKTASKSVQEQDNYFADTKGKQAIEEGYRTSQPQLIFQARGPNRDCIVFEETSKEEGAKE